MKNPQQQPTAVGATQGAAQRLGGPVIERSRTDRPGRPLAPVRGNRASLEVDGKGGHRGRAPGAQTPSATDAGESVYDEQLTTLIAAHAKLPGGLLPLLHAVQAHYGHIPASAVPAIAAGMNLSRAEVHGVITYYTHFYEHALGSHVVQVCRAESCKACGADELVALASDRLGCAPDSTRADGAVSLESVYCLGLCAVSPAATIDGKLQARLTLDSFERLLAALPLTAAELAANGPTAAAPRAPTAALPSAALDSALSAAAAGPTPANGGHA